MKQTKENRILGGYACKSQLHFVDMITIIILFCAKNLQHSQCVS